MNSLKNKTAIITGGGSGLGKAVAIALANEGVNIAITGRNEQKLKDTVAELKIIGVKAQYAIFDITNYEAVKNGIIELANALGSVSILINNAGTAAFGKLNDMEVSEWSNIIQTNVMGTYYVTKVVLPHLLKQDEGDIINIASTAGLNGNANTSAYSASKFAVIGMSESLMKEVRKDNIRVSTYVPSTFESDMSIDAGVVPIGSTENVLQTQDIAELIVASLKLPRRALLKSVSIWSTNP